MLQTVLAAMLGHAVADAMGVPVEFKFRDTLREDPVTDYRGFGSHHVPAGTWSDGTSMNLATIDSLCHGLNYEDMMQRFRDWYANAAYTATDEVFDIGISTGMALARFARGVPAQKCGGDQVSDNGNGSLMRMIPAILYCKYRLPDAPLDSHIEIIHNVSRLTHAHDRSLIGCGIYYFILSELMDRPDKSSIIKGIAKARDYYREFLEFTPYQRLTDEGFAHLPDSEIKSSGYVVATLEAAIWCLLTTDSYSECILKAVNLGKDTDTVAAVAGGLAGVLYGLDSIPQRWRSQLIRHEVIEQMCAAFCDCQ